MKAVKITKDRENGKNMMISMMTSLIYEATLLFKLKGIYYQPLYLFVYLFI